VCVVKRFIKLNNRRSYSNSIRIFFQYFVIRQRGIEKAPLQKPPQKQEQEPPQKPPQRTRTSTKTCQHNEQEPSLWSFADLTQQVPPQKHVSTTNKNLHCGLLRI